jgi:hypothetical protein
LPKECGNLKVLYLQYNNFHQDLSFLQGAVNLEIVELYDNKFYGSLEYLKEMKKLRRFSVRDTDVDRGLEYLPESIEYFFCSKGENAKFKAIYNLLADEKGEVEVGEGGWVYAVKNFPQKLREYKQKLQEQSQQSQIEIPPK